MKLRTFDKTDWETFPGAVGTPQIAEFENDGISYVVITDSTGLTITRYLNDDEFTMDFVTIEMHDYEASALANLMAVDFKAFDELIDEQEMTFANGVRIR